MNTTQIQSLHESIEAIKDYDFSGEFKTDIYLDPEEKRVYPFTNTRSMPASAHNGIDKHIISVQPSAIPVSVYNYLVEVEDDLTALIDEYQGSEHNGRNWIGSWSRESEDILQMLHLKAEDAIANYWEADEWFSPVLGELKDEWKAGKDAETIIDENGCGNEIDGMCDRAEAITWLTNRIAEWEKEDNDED